MSSQPFPLVSSSRWLKKRGELAVCSEELSIWRAFSHRSYYLFLFNDVLIVTKKKRSVGLKFILNVFHLKSNVLLEKVFIKQTDRRNGQMFLIIPACQRNHNN